MRRARWVQRHDRGGRIELVGVNDANESGFPKISRLPNHFAPAALVLYWDVRRDAVRLLPGGDTSSIRAA